MSIYFTPLMLSDDGKYRLPAPPGRKLAPAVLPVDPDRANAMSVTDDGMLVKLDLAYDPMTSTLTLTGEDGFVIARSVIPVEAGILTNAEVLGDFTPPNQPKGTYLHLTFKLANGGEKDVYLDVSELVDVYTAGFAIAIENNVVSVVPEKLLNPHEKLLTIRNGTINAQPGLVFDKATQTLSLTGVDGAVLASTEVPASISSVGPGLTVAEDGTLMIDIDALASLLAAKLPLGVSDDEDNALSLGSDKKPYFPGDLGKL